MLMTALQEKAHLAKTATDSIHEHNSSLALRSRLNIYGGFHLHLSSCMHDPSFMTLALIVSEKNDIKTKNSTKISHESVNRKK